MARNVVITGIGLITPMGVGTAASWEGLLAGRNGIGAISRFDASEYPARIAGEIPDFDIDDWVDKKTQKKIDPFIAYGLAASELALKDAGWDEIPEEIKDRFGVIVGSGIGGLTVIEREHKVLLDRGPRRMTPFFIPALIINMASGQISMRWGLRGPNSAVVTACATGNHAIGDSAELIRRGKAEVMLAGGAEAVVAPLTMGGFGAMRALSTRNDEPERASRPWDRDRDGFVIGEGAGILVLEEEERARARGARIYASVAGYGMSADAYHLTAPHPEGEGAARAMRLALEDAGASPDEVDYVNAHGTSTPEGDRVETIAIKSVYKDHAPKLRISSTKSMIGHLLGAAGGVETAVTALSLHHGVMHPTRNLENPSEDCDLDYLPGDAREADIRLAMTNSFGFGGTNAILLLRKFEG